MEFNEKLQELRKSRGLTQEELAAALFVSRTAISKWESGRGIPNIESLKAISGFFSVSIDELLSSGELLVIAEDDQKQKESRVRDLVFGICDVSAALLLFLPFFGQASGNAMQSVSLIALTAPEPWLTCAYYAAVAISVIFGILILALQSCRGAYWLKGKWWISLAINILGTVLFILSRQPYAAVFVFIFLIIKALMLIKRS